MKYSISLIPSDMKEVWQILQSHKAHLANPFDSYCEDRLEECGLYKVLYEGTAIGYAGIIGEELCYFHVIPLYFRIAQKAFDYCIREMGIKKVNVLSQDYLLVSLIAEWDYSIEREACYFIDAGRMEKPRGEASEANFRTAVPSDKPMIVEKTGDFFDKLEAQIRIGTIFVLEKDKSLMGCGIVEQGRLFSECVSIGMITCREHRRKGVAGTILWNLKEWAYGRGLRPVAGCWYYNVLSRRSLEAAGMIAASKGFSAILLGKEEIPLRTGNPPGELVND